MPSNARRVICTGFVGGGKQPWVGIPQSQGVSDPLAEPEVKCRQLERLVRLRAYVIACQESHKSADDLFSVKLPQYQKEYDKSLPQANAAADAVITSAGVAPLSMRSLVSIELHRG